MDAAPLIDPQCTRLKIDGRRGLVIDLDEDREHTIPPGQDGWRTLGECIGRHENLQELTFTLINSTPENLPALLVGVSHNRSVKKLNFCCIYGDWSLEILDTFFENNHNLSSLAVRSCYLSQESVRTLSTVFESCAACSLKEIFWNCLSEGDAIISEFIASLAGLSQLKKLTLHCGNNGRRGCDAVAALLRNPSGTLQMIDLTGDNIGDEGLAALESGVAANSTLKNLRLASIGDITPAAWISFAGILRNPTCILEDLDLDQNIINDDVVVAFADALSGNNTLKEIRFGHRGSISNIGWAAISRALFDESSIINMYRSNHTLRYVERPRRFRSRALRGARAPMLPGDLKSYLELNKDDDKSAVARQKILLQFFKGNFNMENSDENNMDSKVLPHLLSWIGRVTDGKSYTAFFDFLRRVPSLCENAALMHNTRKRKAER